MNLYDRHFIYIIYVCCIRVRSKFQTFNYVQQVRVRTYCTDNIKIEYTVHICIVRHFIHSVSEGFNQNHILACISTSKEKIDHFFNLIFCLGKNRTGIQKIVMTYVLYSIYVSIDNIYLQDSRTYLTGLHNNTVLQYDYIMLTYTYSYARVRSKNTVGRLAHVQCHSFTC